MPTIIIHPSSGIHLQPADPRDPRVVDPYPQTPKTIAAALKAQARDRIEVRRQIGILELTQFVDTYGLENAVKWLKNIARGMGRDL